MWVALVILLIVDSVILYFYIPFDREENCRNNRDWLSILLLIMFPTFMGTSPRYRPRHCLLRFYYALTLTLSFCFCVVFTAFLLNYMKERFPLHQIKSVKELLENDYKLFGSRDVFNSIKKTSLVRSVNKMFINLI